MVQPKNRRFVMEDRLDAELATLNTEIDSKVTGPVDNAEIADGAVTSSKIADGTIVEGDLADGAVTSAKILNGTIVDADINVAAAIAYTKVTRPPLSNASDVTLTSPTSGQALTYNGTGWVNSTPVNSLSGLSDVTITSPAGGEVVKYNAATSKWVNGAAAGGVTASATAPALATAAAGDAWFDTNDGTLYVCYVDPDSTKQWVQVQANSALEGSILQRLGALESQSIAFGSLSPNYIINGGMDIWQRGTSFANVATQTLTADRWKVTCSVLNGTVTQSTDVPDPGFKYSAQLSPAANGTPGEFAMRQLFEMQHIRGIAGKAVTVSFWVKCSKSALKVRLEPYSATGSADTTLSATVTAGAWTRVSRTFTNFTTITAWTAADNATGLSMDIGFADNTPMTTSDYLRITGVQLEVGSTATSFRRNAPSIQAELAACQRYYLRHFAGQYISDGPLGVIMTNNTAFFQFPVSMRVAPSIDAATTSNVGIYNATNLVISGGTTSTSSHNNARTPSVSYVHNSNVLTPGQACMLNSANAAGWSLGLTAEL